MILDNKKPIPAFESTRDGPLLCQPVKSLNDLIPTKSHQHSDGSESEECVGGGFGD